MTIFYWAITSTLVLMIVIFFVYLYVAFHRVDSSPNSRKNAADIKPYMRGRLDGDKNEI